LTPPKNITTFEGSDRAPFVDEENLYLDHITSEIRRAPSDTTRWDILEREGISRPDVMAFDQDILATLTTLRCATMN